MLPAVHIIAPFHNVPAARTPCAFAHKARVLPDILRIAGFSRIVEYANEGSESSADEHVVVLGEAEREAHFPDQLPILASPGCQIFDARLHKKLIPRVQPNDVVAHTFGSPHAHLVEALPQCVHVETGVGYLDKPFGAYRIFESHAWRHFHWALAEVTGTPFVEHDDRSRSWVIPMAFNEIDWPRGDGAGDQNGPFALFMGRLVMSKGLRVLGELLERLPWLRIKLAGRVVHETLQWHQALGEAARARAELVGPVLGPARAELAGKAFCALMPTQGVEPFGASGVEAMLTGTRLIASSWGAFPETVGELGSLCGAIDEWVEAVRAAAADTGKETRHRVAAVARHRFSLSAVAPRYRRAFEQMGVLEPA